MARLPKSIFLFVILATSSCSGGQRLLNNTAWLKGTWASNNAKGILYETWKDDTDTSRLAKSYYLNKNDTILFESVALIERNNKLYYIVSAPEEKGEAPVAFESTAVYKDSVIFENKSNFFPQKIRYQKLAQDSLVAEVSGVIEGEFVSEQFRMGKIK